MKERIKINNINRGNIMTNIEKNLNVFTETIGITADETKDLKYQSIEAWDSVGHMGLVANIEDSFEIMFDADDIIDFSSFRKGIEILRKYNIEL